MFNYNCNSLCEPLVCSFQTIKSAKLQMRFKFNITGLTYDRFCKELLLTNIKRICQKLAMIVFVQLTWKVIFPACVILESSMSTYKAQIHSIQSFAELVI